MRENVLEATIGTASSEHFTSDVKLIRDDIVGNSHGEDIPAPRVTPGSLLNEVHAIGVLENCACRQRRSIYLGKAPDLIPMLDCLHYRCADPFVTSMNVQIEATNSRLYVEMPRLIGWLQLPDLGGMLIRLDDHATDCSRAAVDI